MRPGRIIPVGGIGFNFCRACNVRSVTTHYGILRFVKM